MRGLVVVLLTVVVVVSSCVGWRADAVSFDLGPGKKECIYEVVRQPGTTVTMAYAVTSGSQMDIDVLVTDADGGVLVEDVKQGQGKKQFVAEKMGRYAFCFSNQMSVVSHKTVKVVIDTDDAVGEDLQALAKRDNLDAVEKAVVSVSHLVRMVEFHQANYRQLHDRHLSTVVSTNQRVRIWSLIECLSVVLVAALQVYFIKRAVPLQAARGHMV
ncbi:Transmembrane emp24 domain-containing protein 7 [Porphyridium purpureum]|uniref:Transmembrane emp24 domain-containing protein 7 n=1 Tax=Porphyridium purpureum TaxID=35688 RepID=A0A5J4Z6Y0_PORPP|nr:Transmembrane emp24 domain-containing protein 7 [Porphyridium purpureum]|eukprot:POR6266..scf295_1